jgi:hypothetical protein
MVDPFVEISFSTTVAGITATAATGVSAQDNWRATSDGATGHWPAATTADQQRRRGNYQNRAKMAFICEHRHCGASRGWSFDLAYEGSTKPGRIL